MIMALSIVASISVPVLAEPTEGELNNQLKQQQNQLQQDKNSLNGIEDEMEELEHQIELSDLEIEGIMRQVNDIKKKIDQTQKDIKIAEADIKTAENDMQKEKDVFNKRMRAMYISGLDGYLDILLESKGFNDFLSRVEAVRRIIDADKKIIADLNAKKEQIEVKKQALGEQNEGLIALKSENEQKLVKLNETKSNQSKIIASLKAERSKHSAKLAESQKIVNETLKQIKAIRDRIPKYEPSRGASTYSQDAVVAYAANFLGTNYVWGGETPNPGFDCSGYMQYVFRHFGISLPRVAASQAGVGTAVSRDQLQPGDLVFFKKPGKEIHHVGMYVGNNSYIHAPQTGDVVKISPLTRSDYYTARRIK
jgi:peptidoglycan hydrolase CwlO-like protein